MVDILSQVAIMDYSSWNHELPLLQWASHTLLKAVKKRHGEEPWYRELGIVDREVPKVHQFVWPHYNSWFQELCIVGREVPEVHQLFWLHYRGLRQLEWEECNLCREVLEEPLGHGILVGDRDQKRLNQEVCIPVMEDEKVRQFLGGTSSLSQAPDSPHWEA